MLKSMTSLVLALALGLSLAAGERKPVKPVNPNTATVTELMQLPGVGAKTAERILEYRKQHGPFQRLEDPMNVKGIGDGIYNRLKDEATVSGAPAKKAQPAVKK